MKLNTLPRCSTLLILVLAVVAPLHAETGTGQFDAFFQAFKAAVLQRDKATLTWMMAPEFEFYQSLGVSAGQVFQGLDADNGRGWANLQNAITNFPAVYAAEINGQPRLVLNCTRPQPIQNCLVTFEQDAAKQWRWKGMIMPLL